MEYIRYEYFHDKDTALTISKSFSVKCSLHFHRCIEILYVLDGNMLSTVANKLYGTQEDDVVFVHSYYKHAFTPAPYYKKIFLIIPLDLADDIDPAFVGATLPALLTDREFNRREIRPIIEKMLYENGSMNKLTLKGYLNVLLGLLLKHYKTVPIERNKDIDSMVDILNYIDVNCDKPLTLDSLSSAFGYNKYYFSRLFNRVVGENLNNYVNVIRLQHFIRLSKEDEKMSVAERAFACGFDSLTTFYRCFDKLYGFTPREMLASDKQ